MRGTAVGGCPGWKDDCHPTGVSCGSGEPEQCRHETSSGDWRTVGGRWTSIVATAAAVDLALFGLTVVLPDRLTDPSHTGDPAGNECHAFELQ